jgi:DNA-directed RNA polymerase specialized sigma24 family protein
MARDDRIEARLRRWAEASTVGDGSGYPVMSTIHADWTPPSPGITPTLKVAPASDVGETHRAIARLSMRLRDTVVIHYVQRPSLPEQALRLRCSEATVYTRVEEAHRQLARLLDLGYCRFEEVG